MKPIKKILEGIYNDKELRKSCIPLFIGQPGLGKTSSIKQFAEEKRVRLITQLASTKMPHEISGCAIANHDTGKMTYYDYDELLNMKDGDILFLDELLNANPMILNAFLNVLEERTLPSGKKLANIMIVAAANYQGAVSLTPQIKERFIWYDMKFDKYSYKEYMAKYLITDTIHEQLCSMILNESFPTGSSIDSCNYITPRSIEKAINMVINGVPTPYENKLKNVLNTLIPNPTGNQIKHGDFVMEPDQQIPWIDLLKIIKK